MLQTIFGKAVFPLIWLVFIHFLFFIPSSNFVDAKMVEIPYFDKVVHFGFFFVLVVSWGLYVFLRIDLSLQRKKNWIIILVLIAILDGIVVEFIQVSPLIHRDFDWYDAIADGLGAICGGLALKYAVRYLKLTV